MFGDGPDDVMQNGQARCSVYSLMVRDSPQRVNFPRPSLAHDTTKSLTRASDDHREGVTPFREKRAPHCQDR